MVMWRKDCDLCHEDAEPASERVHEYVHTLVEAVAAHDAECADLESRIEELGDATRRLRKIIENLKAGTAP